MKCAAALLLGSTLVFIVLRSRRKYIALEKKLAESEAALQAAQKQRFEERTGRIRAQQELRKELANNVSKLSFPMTPIGYMRSCYSTRNGTPRQPSLATLGKSCLQLPADGVPYTALHGLEQFSHCWLIYVFHENTDLPNLWKQPDHRGFKAKVRVPRLDGKKLGVFATRSPHRPCPIGLTVAKVEGICDGVVMLSGADLVDGTPVLDIKPYLPYCDCVEAAVAPGWVNDGGADDPLIIKSVEFTDAVALDLADCWKKMGKHSLYSSLEEFQEFVKQVLSRDIRSLNQRHNPHNGVISELARRFYGDDNSQQQQQQQQQQEQHAAHAIVYNVILEGLKISYTVDDGRLRVVSANISHKVSKPK